MKMSSFHFRIKIVSFLFLFVALLVIARLFFVQIIHQNYYSERADRQYSTPYSNIFKRNSIFFSKKDGAVVAAATVSSGFKVAINPEKIGDKEIVYEKLKPYLNISRDTFIYRASKTNDPYEEVASNLTQEQINEIENIKLDGVSIFKDNWRFYPGGELASHTLGFLAYKGDDRVGQYGLERYYDKILSRSKDDVQVNFFAEVFSNIKENLNDSKQGDIVTTIEPIVQSNLEKEMEFIASKWSPDQIGGIIINPQNGEIYAMAGSPSFDLNNYKEVTDTGVYRNPLVENVFEFGSVIKPLVVASAIDQGVVTPETKYYDNGFVVVNKKEIKNFDSKGRGEVTVQDILDQSLNTGMVFVEGKLGHDKFRTYMKSYGIGEKTGIDLPNETSGLINNLNSPRDIEYANASFGQGIALTPIGAVRAFSVLANGGNLITPHLVKEIWYEDKTKEKIDSPIAKSSIIKKETSETISRMLVHVFERYDGGIHKMEHYSIASKTGTGQVAKEEGGGYYEGRHMHSFFGYFPAYDPQFLVFLYALNPKGAQYASQTLIPPFVDITKFLLNYYNIAPDR